MLTFQKSPYQSPENFVWQNPTLPKMYLSQGTDDVMSSKVMVPIRELLDILQDMTSVPVTSLNPRHTEW